MDSENPNLGRYFACRRVARTIYMGSAPTLRGANRGLEDNQIKLGCVQPGESAATFGDALRRLTDRATYLYLDGNRYWVSTQPNVNRTAQERAHQFLDKKERIEKEISDRLRKDKSKGEFCAVHIAPKESADIPDDPRGVRLVVINPQYPHISNSNDSPARQWVEDVLNHKGNSQRYHKNTLLFLAPDNSKIENLERNVAQYLAWNSIVNDKEQLNLDAFQEKQATTKRQQSSQDVDHIGRETYEWLLVPNQPDPQGPIEWKETRLPKGQDSPIERSSKKAVHEGDLLDECAASILRMEALDSFLWSDSNHISVKRLWECLTQYPYLPRLKNQNVLLAAIRDGVAANDFAYAEGFKDRYIGLKAGTDIDPTISNESLLVKPAIAQKQLDAEVVPQEKAIARSLFFGNGGKTTGAVREAEAKNYPSSSDRSLEEQGVGETPVLRRFYGNIEMDALRVNRDVLAIANEVIQHLTSLNGSNVKVTLEIEAEIPDFSGTVGFPDEIVRTVTENCRTLKFKTQEFEE